MSQVENKQNCPTKNGNKKKDANNFHLSNVCFLVGVGGGVIFSF